MISEFTSGLANVMLKKYIQGVVVIIPRYKNLNPVLQEYIKEMPVEVKNLLIAIGDLENLCLLIALMEHGKMNFSEMKEKFQLNSSSLTNRLTVLQNGNLVKNFYEKTTERKFSYYDVTDVPGQVLKSVYEILYPMDFDEDIPSRHG